MNLFIAWFNKEDLCYNYRNPLDFYLPQWQTSEKLDLSFLVYRLFNTGYFYTIFYFSERATWNVPHNIKVCVFLYYTYWSFLISTLTSLVFLIVSVLRMCEELSQENNEEQSDKKTNLPIWFKLQYALSALNFDATITTSCGFWTLVYFYQNKSFHLGSCILHLWNTIILLIDFMIVRVPVRLSHGIYSVLLTIVYFIFTFFYYISGGKSLTGQHYLYKMLDYQNPGLVCAGIVAVMTYVVLARLLAYGLFKLRVRIFTIIFTCEDEGEEMVH
ncbi:protein rolling stone-like [Dendroctonus ponderosae]|uniref:protein rolling stone-like n=1 Tax=Dendroctonus ponderosae TaxID=77166 RepID=UPI0020362DB3|nr:protein rolling stone-like [Dendroctonus ponderosae]